MTLYNCKHAGDEYRITKFDQHMNVESSYLCNAAECNCPAGVRPSCRHRQMLPKFIQRKTIDSDWMYDFDRGGWVQIALSAGELGQGLSVIDEASSIPPEMWNLSEGKGTLSTDVALGGLPVPAAKPTFRRRL